MGQTPKYALTYPENPDLADGPNQQRNFLQQVEDLLSTGQVDLTQGGISVADPAVGAHAASKSYVDRVTAVPTGFRNVVRNGDMQIAQRGNGPFTAGYNLDGWQLGGSYDTIARVFDSGNMPWQQNVVAGGSNASDFTMQRARIEDVMTLNGRAVTVSFRAYASAAGLKLSVEAEQTFGTGGSAPVQTNAGMVTLTTAPATYSLTFTMPSTVGKTFGTGGTNTSMNFFLSAGSNFAARTGVGVQSGTFNLTDVQLEAGSVATPFERLPVQQQYSWCRRYFQRIGKTNPHSSGVALAPFAWGHVANATTAYVSAQINPAMRAGPTITFAALSNFNVFRLDLGSSVGGFNQQMSGPDRWMTSCTGCSGLTPGHGVELVDITGNAYIDFSAEL